MGTVVGRPELVASLAEFSGAFAHSVSIVDDSTVCLYWPGIGSLTAEVGESGSLMVSIWIRSLSNDWPGDRTDLNELFAILIAFALHEDGVSVDNVFVEHPVAQLPGETYATYLIPRQPYPTGFPPTTAGVKSVERLIMRVSVTVHYIRLVLEACGFEWPNEGSAAAGSGAKFQSWSTRLCELIGSDAAETTFSERRRPSWWFLRAESGFLAFRSGDLCHAMRAIFDRTPIDAFDGPTGRLLRRGELPPVGRTPSLRRRWSSREGCPDAPCSSA